MKSCRLILFISIIFFFMFGCTKLNETVQGNLTSNQVSNNSTSIAVLLQRVYSSLERTFTNFLEIFALSDISTDEAIVPTRGNNWDDNGVWRVLHQHKWDGSSGKVLECFNLLGGVVFAATDMLKYNATPRQKAEARFLRALAMYWMLDLFDQVPHRLPGESLTQPSAVWKGTEALDSIIGEVCATITDLPDGPPYNMANKFAAKVLLMKCYLNRAVYFNRANPSFVASDMNKVISLADEIINSNKFSFSANYFDNFCPANSILGKENIFTQSCKIGGELNISLAWLAPYGYGLGGFNGFTTLSDFYNKFGPADKRKGQVYSYPNSPPNPANEINVGFLIGQQYDIFNGSPLGDNYTADVKIIEPGPDLNNPGIRPIKYAPDYNAFYFWYGAAANEFVYFRLPDILLMKAEAILRGGTATNAGPYGNSANSLVNAIRTDPSRGATTLSSVSLDDIYDERGRELWWEGWRRQDMIRFKKFLLPFQEKNYPSDPKYLLFPIPDEQLSVNPNLHQNPGY
jgi:hypothetical protein